MNEGEQVMGRKGVPDTTFPANAPEEPNVGRKGKISHHVAWLYNYAGEPCKTQHRVREIHEELYRTGPGGLCGNEDMGSLSSWYVLSSMGIYPVTPVWVPFQTKNGVQNPKMHRRQ